MLVVVGNSALGYVFWTVCARQFSASFVGTASAVVSTATLVALSSDLGVRTIVMQEPPRARGGKEWSEYVSAAILVASISAGLVGGLIAVFLSFVKSDLSLFMTSLWPACFVILAMVNSVGNLLDGISTAERRPAGLLGRAAVTSITKPLLLVLMIVVGFGGWHSIVLATLLSIAISLFWGIGFQLRNFHEDWRFRLDGVAPTVKRIKGQLLGHHLMNLGGQLPMYIMPLEVVARLSAQDNAYMSLTWLVCGAFLLVSPSVSSALFVAGRWDPHEMKATVLRAGRIIAALLVPLGFFTILLGKWVLGIFGHDYAVHGYSLLVILTLSSIPDAYTNIKIAIYRANAELDTAVKLNVGMGVTSVALTWLTLPSLGIDAVGWSWMASQVLGSVWAFSHDKRHGAANSSSRRYKGKRRR